MTNCRKVVSRLTNRVRNTRLFAQRQTLQNNLSSGQKSDTLSEAACQLWNAAVNGDALIHCHGSTATANSNNKKKHELPGGNPHQKSDFLATPFIFSPYLFSLLGSRNLPPAVSILDCVFSPEKVWPVGLNWANVEDSKLNLICDA